MARPKSEEGSLSLTDLALLMNCLMFFLYRLCGRLARPGKG